MSNLSRLGVVGVALLLAMGCGKDEDTKKKNSVTTGADTGNNVSDTGGQNNVDPDMGGPADMAGPRDSGSDMTPENDMSGTDMGADLGADMNAPDMAMPTCDRNALIIAQEGASWFTGNNFFIYSAFTADPMAGGMYDFLSFEIYPDFGGVVGPQQYTYPELNYADCGTCLLIFADCMQPGGCMKTFLVNSGSVAVSAAGSAQDDPFQAVFTDLIFDEVTIDPNTFVSTAVAGGETYCIETLPGSTTTQVEP